MFWNVSCQFDQSILDFLTIISLCGLSFLLLSILKLSYGSKCPSILLMRKKIRSNLSAAGKKEPWYCSNDLANPVKYFEFVF